MKKISFLFMLLIFFFSLLNFYIIPLVKSIDLKESFIVLFGFWFAIIVVLYFVSNALALRDSKKGE